MLSTVSQNDLVTVEFAWREAVPNLDTPAQGYLAGWLRVVTVDELMQIFESLKHFAAQMRLDPADTSQHAISYVSAAAKRTRKARDPEYKTYKERQAAAQQQQQCGYGSSPYGSGPYGDHGTKESN